MQPIAGRARWRRGGVEVAVAYEGGVFVVGHGADDGTFSGAGKANESPTTTHQSTVHLINHTRRTAMLRREHDRIGLAVANELTASGVPTLQDDSVELHRLVFNQETAFERASFFVQ